MKIVELFTQVNPYDYKLYKPYIIAEAGVNHEGNIELAKRLINEAKEGGADAIKFQTYKAETIASKNSPYYWDITKEPTQSQYELFKKYDSFWKDEFTELKKTCDQVGIEFMSTPFDIESATFLNDLMDVFKISSSDLTNKPFIEHMCSFKKPIILSTGAAFLHEVEESVSWIKPYNVPLSLLHCVLNYPTADENANLGMILGLKRKFPELIIGYSDHTLPAEMKNLEIANLLGAVILEKHFTFDKSLPGNDHYHAMDKEDLKKFVKNIGNIHKTLGSYEVVALETEAKAIKNARRSLVAKKDIPAGKVIEESDLTFKRPAFGVSPKFIGEIVGKKAIKLITEDEIIQWSMIEQ
jgi:N-acetylneuraminate synthase